MSITPTPENFGFLILLTLSMLLVLPVLAIIGAILGKLFKSDSLPIVFMLGTCAAVFFGGSLYLDRTGTVTPAQVVSKSESIRINGGDSAFHRYDVKLSYSVTGKAESDTVQLSEAEFDSVHPGESIQLRAVRLFGMFTLKRLAAQTTLTILPWNIALPVLALITLIWLMVKVRRLRGVIFIVGFIACIACIAFALTRLQVGASQTQTATATVRRIEHIVPDHGNDPGVLDNVIWADTGLVLIGLDEYNFVELEYTPQGRNESVVAVDVVNTSHKIEVGGTVPVRYAPDAPRSAQISFSERRAWLQNGAALAVVGGVLLLIAYGLDRLLEGRKRAS